MSILDNLLGGNASNAVPSSSSYTATGAAVGNQINSGLAGLGNFVNELSQAASNSLSTVAAWRDVLADGSAVVPTQFVSTQATGPIDNNTLLLIVGGVALVLFLM